MVKAEYAVDTGMTDYGCYLGNRSRCDARHAPTTHRMFYMYSRISMRYLLAQFSHGDLPFSKTDLLDEYSFYATSMHDIRVSSQSTTKCIIKLSMFEGQRCLNPAAPCTSSHFLYRRFARMTFASAHRQRDLVGSKIHPLAL